MKNVRFGLLVLLGSMCLFGAQELNADQVYAFKYDDVEKFKTAFAEKHNQCFLVNKKTYSPIVIAIKTDRIKVFQYLIDSKSDIEKSCEDKTPLMYAAQYGKLDMVKELLKAGAKKDVSNPKGNKALDYAVRENNTAIIELLK